MAQRRAASCRWNRSKRRVLCLIKVIERAGAEKSADLREIRGGVGGTGARSEGS